MISRQLAGVASSALVLAACVAGLAAGSPRPSSPATSPTSAASGIPAVTAAAVAPDTTIPSANTWITIAGWLVPDSTYKWPGVITADSVTGALRSDLGWGKPGVGSTLHTLQCYVATKTSAPARRVLLGPVSPIVAPTYLWSDCVTAFHTWDSLEAKTGGKWPAGS
jgi:hypothetical protein